ncbi:CotY/CotZ family spore coat protein [Lentibacillus sp. CBA3610]|uniref:CotY/CotZ family spore coat protein n=1 Tax=Lentibacillus sp. CBA3610 TaxID=2518176 RepID=UPI001595A168|nr:CotY/CotZ family spore coat protein [Lentibacillus sp. CBA3610]QKY68625.1 spore coat protein [Lentibacillus sp. CBA3610]
MGCGKEHHSGNCVCDVLREIVEAQEDVVENCCSTSCEQSISDLLGETDGGNGLDTVPVILYCKDGCKPFKGFGANPDDIGDMTSSFYFRVKKVDDDCCAVVELLRDPHDDDDTPKDPVDQYTKHLCATGICITVDLDCFCHVTCLPAVNAFN